jgi:hypothetical protein
MAKIENEIINIKDKLEMLNLDMGPGGIQGSRRQGIEDEIQSIWSFL